MKKNVRKIKSSKQSVRARRVAYSLAAGAAASGIAGNSADEANAQIVYSGPQNIAVTSGFSQNIDMDLDGQQDINLQNFNFFGGPYQGAGAVFFPGELVGFVPGFAYVSALSSGYLIDAASTNIAGGSMAYGAVNPNAQFNNVTDAYVGIGFPSGPNFYYGWVRVDVNNAAKTLLIKDWAYNATSGASIVAGQVPEPGTLGMLAAGAAGVFALRRRRKDAA